MLFQLLPSSPPYLSSKSLNFLITAAMRSFCAKLLMAFLVFSICSNCFCLGEADVDGAPMEELEREALYSTIQGFVGNWWNGSDLYPDPCGWTPIQGVSCDLLDGVWYVTALNIGPIHDNSLFCDKNVEFRQQLFELKHLKSLSFYNCFVSPRTHRVSIPTKNWEKLAESLELLEFRSNPGLIGPIPRTFTGLKKLQSLILLENGLVGELPKDIGGLIDLKRLVFSGNSLSGQIPESIGLMSELLILDLGRNSLSGPLPDSIGNLKSLLKLDVGNNFLEGTLPNGIGGLKKLSLLDLSNNNFSGGLTKSLEEMVCLEEMVLSNNPIGGELKVLNWKKLQNLVTMEFSNMGLEGEVPDSISDLKKVRFLGLNDNKLSGNLSPKFATLPSVGAIYLHGNNLSGVLEFSPSFYQKMGRRFGAWNNSNLCYPFKLLQSSVPFGVKPCHPDAGWVEPGSKTSSESKHWGQNLGLLDSMGVSIVGIDKFWLGFLVEMVLLSFFF